MEFSLEFITVIAMIGLRLFSIVILVAALAIVTTPARAQQKVCENHEADPDAIIKACEKWLKTGRLTAYGKGVAYQNIASAYERKEDIDKALHYRTKAVEAEPSATHYYNRGILHADKGDLDAAVRDYTAALGYQKSFAAHNNRGRVYQAKKDHDRAIDDFTAANKINPELGVALRNRAESWTAKGELEKAEADLTEAIRVEPKSSLNRYRRAGHWLSRKEWDKAIADYDAAIQIQPDAAIAYNDRSLAKEGKGDFRSALADLDAALRLDDKFVIAYANRSDILRKMRENERALADVEKALSINSGASLALTLRARLRIEKGDADGALADVGAVLRKLPDFALAIAIRGWAYEQKGELERAREDYRTVMASSADYDSLEEAKDIARERIAAVDRPAAVVPAVAGAAIPGPDGGQSATDPRGTMRRIALVIGNAAYAVGPLANPQADAQAVAKAFEDLGFDKVILRTDLGVESMRTALGEIAREASNSDLAVVYYAGHGTEREGRNYLIPVDAKLDRASDLELQAIALPTVIDQLSGARRLKLVILDACRNNVFPLSGTRRATTRGLARVEPEDNTLVVFAAKEGTTADDGAGRANSPFTAALLKHIATPGIDVTFVFRRVRDEVMATTSPPQQPHVYGTLGGEEVHFAPQQHGR